MPIVKLLRPKKHSWTTFISNRLKQLVVCMMMMMMMNDAAGARLQSVQKAAAKLRANTRCREHYLSGPAEAHWIPNCFKIQFKIMLIHFKSLCDLDLRHISFLNSALKLLRSENQMLFQHIQHFYHFYSNVLFCFFIFCIISLKWLLYFMVLYFLCICEAPCNSALLTITFIYRYCLLPIRRLKIMR